MPHRAAVLRLLPLTLTLTLAGRGAAAQPAAGPPASRPLTRADSVPPRTADEHAVWSLVTHGVPAGTTPPDGAIFVSGAYPHPLLLGAAGSASAAGSLRPASNGATASSDPEQRRNSVTHMYPVRVVVSQSGDLAYAVALFDLAYDRPDSTGQLAHVRFEGTHMSAWRKMGGRWQAVASFNRPNM